jgi:stage III sporulation protein AG
LKINSLIVKYIKNLKGKWTICILALLGVALLFFGGRLGREDTVTTLDGEYQRSSEEYRATLEARIAEICRRVSGDPMPTVMITLDGGEEYVYARREDGSYIVSSGKGILICRMTPKVKGVAVVCQNGDEAQIKGRITELVCALLGIGANKVSVNSSK